MMLSRRILLAVASGLPFAARAAAAGRIVCPLTAEPSVVIPGVSHSLAARLVGSKLYRGLCRLDAQGVPRPDLASSWEVSADGLTYTFHLLPNLTWHDSGGVAAEDVVFSLGRFHRVLQPGLGLGRIAAIQAADARTVVVTLREAFEPFLRQMDALSTPIVPAHVHDRPGFALDPRAVAPIGCGPFRLADWLRVVRFDWYVGPRSGLAEIAFPVLPDPAARLAMLEESAGLLVGDAVGPELLAQTPAGLVMQGAAPDSIAGLRLNHAARPLDDVRVRLGLACAIDRAGVLRDVWAGQGRVATGPILSHEAAAGLPPYDPRQAAAHLSEAGLRPDDSGVRLRLTHLVRPGAVWQRLAASLRVRLQQVGVEVAPESVTEAEWTRRIAAGAFQTTGFEVGQSGDPSLDLAAYTTDQPGLTALLAKSDAGSLADARALLLREMTQIWLVEPAVPIVRDRRLHMPGGVFDDFATASLS